MSKRATILGIGVLLMVIGAAGAVGWWSREPSYGGRKLTTWLQQLHDTPLADTRRMSEAQAAIRAIGAEKAVPVLLRLAETQDGPIRSWLIRKQQRWNVSLLSLREAEDTQQLGLAGFELLGTNCAPAVPELTRLLNDTNRGFTAVCCLSDIGKPGEPALWSGLTNHNSQVRELAISALAAATGPADECIARMRGSLRDPDSMVRGAALRAIAGHTEAPDIAIPLIVAAFEDHDEFVAASAAGLLSGFGTNGLRALGALTNAMERGRPSVANRALRSLVSVAPQEALPYVLERLRSPDPQRRRGAVVRLRTYPVTTPEIRSALETAAADPDARVAQTAQEAITRLNQGGWPDEQSVPNLRSDRFRRFGATNALRGIDPSAGARRGMQ